MQDNATSIDDGDLAWIRVLGGDGSCTARNTSNNNVLYGSSQYLNIRRSTNGGINFSYIPVPSGGTEGFIAPFILGISNPNMMYAGSSRVHKSTNGGTSWITTNNGNDLDGNPILTFAISSINSDKVFASTAPVNSRARIFRTTNAGSNWDNVTSSLPDRYPIDIAVDPTNDEVVYVVFSGFGSSHIYKSTNSGNIWTDIGQSLPDVPTSSVIVDPLSPNHIYLGNDIGVYVSTNGGTNWSEFQNGMTDAAIIMDLSISPNNRKLRAATHGKGVFEKDLLSPTVGISTNIKIIEDYKLGQNFPNPFNPVTHINYQLPRRSYVSISVFDVSGREVKTLLKESQTPGSYVISFDASEFSSGIYFYRMSIYSDKLKTEKFVDTKKMILIK